MDDYVQIMLDSLCRKEEILDKIIAKNEAQSRCIAGKEYEDIDWDAFNLLVTEKDILIGRINTMDEGFQNLYDKVNEQLIDNKDRYADQIRQMQEIIKRLTDKSVKIQTGEERNRQAIESTLMGRKKVIRTTRNSLKAADSYHQTMTGNYGMDNSIKVNNRK